MNLMITRREKTPIMHRIVEHNDVVYLGGVIADDTEGVSMRGQITQVCAKLDKLLAEADSDKHKLLSATLFITDMSQKQEMNEVWTSWLEARDLPTRATIGVSDLGQDVLIEVVVTAVR
jgi:enamine deaminase RidA (YjgF/YER057c/UK114 family)